jgi:hypothetical protein
MAAATSHVHLTGWFLSPELALSREEEPLVVRTLLAELADRIDVRVLLWKGAPIPAFRPSRGDVREMEQTLTRHTKIRTALDSCAGLVGYEKSDRAGGARPARRQRPISPPHRAHGRNRRGEDRPIGEDVADHFRLRWRAQQAKRSQPKHRLGDVQA